MINNPYLIKIEIMEGKIFAILMVVIVAILFYLCLRYMASKEPQSMAWEERIRRLQESKHMWQCPEWSVKKQNLWHSGQGSNLPVYDREVVVLVRHGESGHKVCFGHRPDPNGVITMQSGEKLYAKTYDEGGWNIPDVLWWLDAELPIKD